MGKSNSNSSSKSSSKSSSSKSSSSKRHKPLSPPGGFSGKRSRYEEGGEIDW